MEQQTISVAKVRYSIHLLLINQGDKKICSHYSRVKPGWNWFKGEQIFLTHYHRQLFSVLINQNTHEHFHLLVNYFFISSIGWRKRPILPVSSLLIVKKKKYVTQMISEEHQTLQQYFAQVSKGIVEWSNGVLCYSQDSFTYMYIAMARSAMAEETAQWKSLTFSKGIDKLFHTMPKLCKCVLWTSVQQLCKEMGLYVIHIFYNLLIYIIM